MFTLDLELFNAEIFDKNNFLLCIIFFYHQIKLLPSIEYFTRKFFMLVRRRHDLQYDMIIRFLDFIGPIYGCMYFENLIKKSSFLNINSLFCI